MNKKNEVEIPSALIEAVKNSSVILFLGAGASMEAVDQNGKRAPSGDQLAKEMCAQFLREDLSSLGLMQAAEICVGKAGQNKVFNWIGEQFRNLIPSTAHELIPTFQWATIATTNYDNLVEDAYAKMTNSTQDLIRFVKNQEMIETKRHQAANPLNYLKLHGCIDHAHDTDIPLVLDNAHYERYILNRERLFVRLEDLAQEMPIIFIGYNLSDPHIQNLIHRLDRTASRPEYYVVAPNIPTALKDHWRSKRIIAIDAKFGAFMIALDGKIMPLWRQITSVTTASELPLQKHFRTNSPPSDSLINALENDLYHVNSSMKLKEQNAQNFYKGYDLGFTAVAAGFDVRRRVANDLILHLIDSQSAGNIDVCLLLGAAGSGKTVALKRIAWEIAKDFDEPVFWASENGFLSSEYFSELYNLTGKRTFLFVDRISQRINEIHVLLNELKELNVPLTLVVSEREHAWNLADNKLEDIWKPTVFNIGKLSKSELEELLTKMKTHSSLGVIASLALGEQIAAFENADGHLLVALHEVTKGKPFEEIILDEFGSITPDKAMQLYLDICTLHQFGSPVRAGLINRISSIPFTVYKEEFFEPLEGIVISEQNKYTGDYLYRARHRRVASLTFKMAMPDDQSRVQQISRVLEHLDEGYSSDEEAIRELINAKKLMRLLSSLDACKAVLSKAENVLGKRWYLYHQKATLELNHPKGSIETAEKEAQEANSIDQNKNSVLHTLAEISRFRAIRTKDPERRKVFRKQARERLAKISNQKNSYSDGSRCKLFLDEMRDALSEVDLENQTSIDLFNDKTTLAKREIDRAILHHPVDPELLKLRADFYGLLQDNENAKIALERAWMLDTKGPNIALQLNRLYLNNGDFTKVKEILDEAILRYPNDYSVNFAMARYCLSASGNDERAAYFLARSYSASDRDYVSRFLHAQYLFWQNEGDVAEELFNEIDQNAPADYLPKSDYKVTHISKKIARITGRVVNISESFCFIKFPNYPENVYASIYSSSHTEWSKLKMNAAVSSEIAFNRRGSIAVKIAAN